MSNFYGSSLLHYLQGLHNHSEDNLLLCVLLVSFIFVLNFCCWKSYNTVTLLTPKFPYRNISRYVITEIITYLQVLPYVFDLCVQPWEWVTITTVWCYQHGKIKIQTYLHVYIHFSKDILKASRRASINDILSSKSTQFQKLFF